MSSFQRPRLQLVLRVLLASRHRVRFLLRRCLLPCPLGLQRCALLRGTWSIRMVPSLRRCFSNTSSERISRWSTSGLWLFPGSLRSCSRAWSCCTRLGLPWQSLKALGTPASFALQLSPPVWRLSCETSFRPRLWRLTIRIRLRGSQPYIHY